MTNSKAAFSAGILSQAKVNQEGQVLAGGAWEDAAPGFPGQRKAAALILAEPSGRNRSLPWCARLEARPA